jgi:hypothetical protein
MEALAEARDHAQLKHMLVALVTRYGEWIERQHALLPEQGRRAEVGAEKLKRAHSAQ